MGELNPITEAMSTPLPGITYQRRKMFRPSLETTEYFYKQINCYVFDNTLIQPQIKLGSIRKCWGVCYWEIKEQPSGSHCTMRLSDKWFCQQWFLNTLAHEMVHQWQWDVYRPAFELQHGRSMPQFGGGHGPSFFQWRAKFAEYGLTLKTAYGQKRWFKHQDFKKC